MFSLGPCLVFGVFSLSEDRIHRGMGLGRSEGLCYLRLVNS